MASPSQNSKTFFRLYPSADCMAGMPRNRWTRTAKGGGKVIENDDEIGGGGGFSKKNGADLIL